MTKAKLAVAWAAAILGAAIASRTGLIPEGVAEGLYFGLLFGAGVSISQAPCASC